MQIIYSKFCFYLKFNSESKKSRQNTAFVTSYISDRHGNKINDDIRHFLSQIHRKSSNVEFVVEPRKNRTKILQKLFVSLLLHFENEEKLIVIKLETKSPSNFLAQFKKKHIKPSSSASCDYYGEIVGNKRSRVSINFCDGFVSYFLTILLLKFLF